MIAEPSLSESSRDYLKALGMLAIGPVLHALGRIAYRVAREEHRAWLYRRMKAEHGEAPPETEDKS